MLANAVNLSTRDDLDQYRHEVSATGMYGKADEALRASKLIPDDMDASEAAHDFVFFVCSNLRDADREKGEANSCPDWLARG
jgi:hypothetical protein